MASNTLPTYLSKNRVGTYTFQIRIPKHLQQKRSHFRKSLGTRDFREAVRRSKRLWVKFDQIQRKYFNSPEEFGTAMALLLREDYCQTWEDVQDLHDELAKERPQELNEHLIDQAREWRQEYLSPLQGKIDQLSKQIALLRTAPEKSTEESTEASTQNSPLLSLGLEEFLQTKSDSGLAKSSIQSLKGTIHVFQTILTAINGKEPSISEINASLIRDLYKIIRMYPKNLDKLSQFKKFSATDKILQIKQSSREEFEKRGIAILSTKSINDYLARFREILNYFNDQQLLSNPTLASILMSLTGNIGGKKRVPFDNIDLKKLFQSEQYRLAKFRKSSYYWAPLISLFTGATEAEILQLHISDIRVESDILFFDFNDDGNDKQLKTKNGRARQVPVHSQLIKLGFERYVSDRKKQGSTHLFSEIRNSRGQFRNFSRWFNEKYKVKLGVKAEDGTMKDFHSFRHLVSTKLIGDGEPEYIANEIVGHSSRERSTTVKTYSNGVLLTKKKESIERIKYDIDFNYPKLWRE